MNPDLEDRMFSAFFIAIGAAGGIIILAGAYAAGGLKGVIGLVLFLMACWWVAGKVKI